MLWVVTVLIVAQQLGIPVTSLVALFSVVSLAVSLAVQNVLANVAGGLVLLVTKPFTVGDYIDTPSGEGTVREMSLTYTFLETMEGQRLAVPNSTLSSGKITNYSTLATRRLQHKITASYDDATADVRRACLTAVGRTANVLADPAPGGVRQQLRREQHRVHRAVLDENRGLLAGVLSAAGGDTQRL